MKDLDLGFPDENQRSITDIEREFLIKREWAEFVLRRRIVHCLLGLLILSTIFALILVVLMATGEVGFTAIVIGTLIAGTIGSVGKLLNNACNSLFRTKE